MDRSSSMYKNTSLQNALKLSCLSTKRLRAVVVVGPSVVTTVAGWSSRGRRRRSSGGRRRRRSSRGRRRRHRSIRLHVSPRRGHDSVRRAILVVRVHRLTLTQTLIRAHIFTGWADLPRRTIHLVDPCLSAPRGIVAHAFAVSEKCGISARRRHRRRRRRHRRRRRRSSKGRRRRCPDGPSVVRVVIPIGGEVLWFSARVGAVVESLVRRCQFAALFWSLFRAHLK